MKVTSESIKQMIAQGFITINQYNLLQEIKSDFCDDLDSLHEYDTLDEDEMYDVEESYNLALIMLHEGNLIVIDEPTKNTFMHDYVYSRPLSMNGKDMNRAVYNAIVTRRDISLYSKGITPRRGFKISDVKRYFEIKGTKDILLDAFLSKYDWIFANA